MVWGRAGVGAVVFLCGLWLAAPAWAEAPSLADYAEALVEARLATASARDLDEVRDVLQRAYQAQLAGRNMEAAELLLRVTDGPRFADFREYDEVRGAEFTLSGVLIQLGARQSAQRHLRRLLALGPDEAYFEPAIRLAVDVGLSLDDSDAWAAELAGFVQGAESEDARSELAYLAGHTAHERGDSMAAANALKQVGTRSRFRASAQYLLGAMAASGAHYDRAETRFCSITEAGKDDRYSFFVDGRFFPVRDLAHLGLGRVTHEQGRSDDAFYYYFQVPEDSPRLDEAYFEAAYASYEGGHYDAALDALDQLAAKTPSSPYVTEASLLRGYVHLSRCEFAKAERQLVDFQARFEPLLREVRAIEESAARRRRLYRDLVKRERDRLRLHEEGSSSDPVPNSLLMALLRVDPEFYRLHARVQQLDLQTARSGRLPVEFMAVAESLRGGKTPTRRMAPGDAAGDPRLLPRQLASMRGALGRLFEELEQARRAGAKEADLRELRRELRALDGEALRLERALSAGRAAVPVAEPTAQPSRLLSLLDADRYEAEQMLRESERLREGLIARADALAGRALKGLHEVLAAQLRRAGIGRIDAVMGAKRRLELQVESLAAGRFPPELADPLRMQSLLRDDEEYWPFEGEDWPDEFVERYPDEEGLP